MGERKVLNFYISPDFDASIIPKVKRDWDKGCEIRMMLPFSLRCNTCGEYMYAGKKFNSKKEMVKGEDYLGIRIFRFIIKCSVCSAEITFKTDPKNSDYSCESGASRNFEVWRDNETALEEAKKQREDEDKLDAMKSLENRTIDSKLEMDVLDALDEIKSMNQRHARTDPNDIIAKYNSSSSNQIDDNITKEDYDKIDDEIIKSVKFKNKSNNTSRLNQPLSDSDEEKPTKPLINNSNISVISGSTTTSVNAILSQINHSKGVTVNTLKNSFPIVVAKKKRKIDIDGTGTITNNSTGPEKKIDLKIQNQVNNNNSNSNNNVPTDASKSKPKYENAMSSLLDYGDDDDDEES